MLRVLHIVPALFGPRGITGGGERYAYELARHMAHTVPTTLLTFGDSPVEEMHGELRVRVVGPPWYVRGQRLNPFALSIFPEISRADIVHCHQQHVFASSMAALFGRLARRHTFVTDLGGGGWDVSAYLSTDRWFRGHLHISEYSIRISGHAGNSSVHVILGGVDTEKFSPQTGREEDNSETPIVFVGRLMPHKSVHTVIDAAPPEMPVEIIGPKGEPRYFDFLRERSQGKRVTFRHDVGDEALVATYRRALCVVLPSVYRTIYGAESTVPELLGQTLLEGMACGVPVIGTNVASIPEVVEDGVTGFLVPPDDPAALRGRLLWLRDNPAGRRALGAAGRRRVLERFQWSTVVERCLRIYRGALPDSGAEKLKREASS